MNRYNLHQLRAVKHYMATHNGWRTAGQIQYAIGVTPVEMRQLCQAYTQTFISCGQGYKLVSAATSAELENSLRILMSRADKILHRARSLQRYTLERNNATRRNVKAILRRVA